MKRALSLLLVGVLLFGMASIAGAQGFKRNKFRDRECVCQNLNLTKEQEEFVKKVQDKYGDRAKGLFKEMKEKRKELRELYYNKEAKEKDIVKVYKRLGVLKEKLNELRIEKRLELREIFTKEQLETLSKRESMGRRRGNGKRG